MNIKITPRVTFVEISALPAKLCIKVYTTAKQENAHINTNFCRNRIWKWMKKLRCFCTQWYYAKTWPVLIGFVKCRQVRVPAYLPNLPFLLFSLLLPPHAATRFAFKGGHSIILSLACYSKNDRDGHVTNSSPFCVAWTCNQAVMLWLLK